MIAKKQSLYEKSVNKNVHYTLDDNFLRFWFRFVFRYSYIIEAGGLDRLRQIVERDYEAYSGRILESYFVDMLKERGIYTRIGYWHSRNGENDIDIIAQDEIDGKAEFYEVKRQSKDVNIDVLKKEQKSLCNQLANSKNATLILGGFRWKTCRTRGASTKTKTKTIIKTTRTT